MTDPTQPQSAGQGDALRVPRGVLERLVDDRLCQQGRAYVFGPFCVTHGHPWPCPVPEACALLAEPAAVGAGAERDAERAVIEAAKVYAQAWRAEKRAVELVHPMPPLPRLTNARAHLLDAVDALPAPAGGAGGLSDG